MKTGPACYHLSMNILPKMALGMAMLVTLTACTSLRHFEALSPGERAVLVCERQAGIQRLDADISRYGHLIQSAQQAIATGYRTDQVCSHREVVTGTKTVCQTESTPKGEQVICQEKNQFRRKRECTQVRSRVDVATEQSNIDIWAQTLASSRSERQQRFQACFAEVSMLSAEEAYRRY